jgi:hypothetical protein
MFAGARPYSNDNVAAVVAQVKASGPAMIHGLKLLNKSGVVAYLQVFAKAAANVTLGTTVPDFFIQLAIGESVTIPMGDMPVRLDGAGLSLAGTTGAGNNVGAQISSTLFYE